MPFLPKPAFPCPRALSLLLGIGLGLMPALPARAGIVFTIRQEGPDVVVTGSGSALITPDLIAAGTFSDWNNVFTSVQIYVGPAEPDQGNAATYEGPIGPLRIGSDASVVALPDSSSGGDLFGIVSDNGEGKSLLVLPLLYQSGASLSGTSRFSQYTLTELGLQPGVLTWSWGANGSSDSFQIQIYPEPTPAPLPLAGGAIAWRWSRRMRRLSQR